MSDNDQASGEEHLHENEQQAVAGADEQNGDGIVNQQQNGEEELNSQQQIPANFVGHEQPPVSMSIHDASLQDIVLEFDPLKRNAENENARVRCSEVGTETDLHSYCVTQTMAMTNDEVNLFISVLPNIAPPPLDLETKNICEELDRFEWDFDYRYRAMLPEALRNKIPADQKAAAWTLALGLPARQILRDVEWATGESKDDIPTIRRKLIDALSTPATKRYAVNKFWDTYQAPGESIKAFIKRLENLTAQAGWEKPRAEENMLVRLARALRSKNLRTWILAQPPSVSLGEIKKHCIASEALEQEDQQLQDLAQAKEYEVHENAEMNEDAGKNRGNAFKQRGNGGKNQGDDGGKKQGFPLCNYCGQSHHPGKNPKTGRFNCPASGQVCGYCHRRNHFESVCWLKRQDQQAAGAERPEKMKVSGSLSQNQKMMKRKKLLTLNGSLQRNNKDNEAVPKKKSKKEKTRAVSESSDSSFDTEQERRIANMVAKQLEKAMKAKSAKGSSTDSTPDKPVDFNVDLSDSSDDGGPSSAQARSSFHQVFARRDGGGSSRPGLCGGAPTKSSLWAPKPATLMSEFRIPKIKQPEQHGLSAIERKAAARQKSQIKASELWKAIKARKRSRGIDEGWVDLMQFSETKKCGKGAIRNSVIPGSEITAETQTGSTRHKKSWSENVAVDGKVIKMKVDSGSTVTILTLADFLRLGLSESKLQPTTSRIITYSGNRILPIGKMKAKVSLRGRTVLAKILVIEEASTSLLGFPEGKELGLFRVDYERLAKKLRERVDECISGKDRSENDELPPSLLEIPPCKFSVKLELKDGAKPRILAPRRLPLAIREKVKDELDRMTQLGVISPVNEPREWCHQMVVADKPNGAVRVCLDPRLLNKFIMREEFQIPDFDALASELTEAKVYSTIDLLSGFWQFGLDDKSKELLTFATPFGRYQYNRLPFGLSCAPEMFHKRVVETLAGIPGVLVYIDDILIWGATQEEHDERLRLVQERLKQAEFSVNPKKCIFSQTRVKFLGHMIEDGRLSVDPAKVEAIRKLPSPEDRKALKRILGMLSFIRKFVPDYNALIAPFRPLLKERTPFIWSATEEAALDRIRSSEAWIRALALFRPGKKLTLMSDASSYGLGAVLLQDGCPIYFCSRTLTEAEDRWAQIDKEFLAIVWALERLDLFTYGHRVEVLTDHRPLLGLVDKPMDHCSTRQQRLLGRMLRYDTELKFAPGKEMLLADTLSRAPIKDQGEVRVSKFMGTDLEAEEVFVSECSTMNERGSEFAYTENSDKTKEKILFAARSCEEYQATIQSWYEGFKDARSRDCGEYWQVRNDLFESEGLLFFEGKVVIPKKLRDKYLRALHRGHVGIRATLDRAGKVWWPGMEKEIKEFVRGCACCQKHSDRQRHEPMLSFEIPTAPGLVVASDHFFIGGKTYVLFTDTFSMWTEFFVVPSTSAVHLIRALRRFISRNGIPRVFTADQGAAYTSEEFQEFCRKMDIRSCVSSAKHSQGNAHAEAAVKRVKKWLKRCNDEDDLCMAVLAWHQTPLAQGRPSPSEIHLGRNVRDGLAWRVDQVKVDWNDVRLWREQRNRAAKNLYDRGTRQLVDLQNDQKIWVWMEDERKWKAGMVVKKLNRPRSYLVRLEDGSEIERNRKELKPDLSWHSVQEERLISGVLQECGEGLVPVRPPEERARPVGLQGRRGGEPGLDGRTGERAAESDAGGGRGTEERRRSRSTRDTLGRPLHGGSVVNDPGRLLGSPRRSPQVDPEADHQDPALPDSIGPTEAEVPDSRPRRERQKPVKFKDYVLY